MTNIFFNLYIFKQVPSTKSVPLFMNDQMGKFRVDHNIPSTVTVPRFFSKLATSLHSSNLMPLQFRLLHLQL